METKKLTCSAPQCGYWREESGCSRDENADNGRDICERGEERCEYQTFIVVEGGNVIGAYSDKPEISVEVLDLDNSQVDTEDENALDKMRQRIETITEKYHQIH